MGYTASEQRYETMKYRNSGASGLKLPEVSLGFWQNFGTYDDYENMRQMCFTAFDNGITHFDLANNYGPVPGSAEENLGKILKEDMSAYRDELVISTKAGYHMWEGPYGDWGSRKYLLASLDQSLQRLGLDYVDIFYHHRMDPNTPLEESMMALDQAVKSGKALYAGISNYNRETMKKAIKILKDLKCPFVINQIRYNMIDRRIEADNLPEFAKEEGIGLIAYSPLQQGILTDKYLNGIPENSRIALSYKTMSQKDLNDKLLGQIRALNELAGKRGQTLAQMALSWVMKDEAMTSVLIGASSPEQILDNIGIVGSTEFTQEELDAIDAILLQ